MDACHTISDSWEFQFTHPGKGATATAEPTQVDQEVSIHAPREGCDSILADTYSSRGCFNSRTPGGVRLISVTFVPHSLCVSIHAPREGCDTSRSRHHHRANSFNSRTPGGVRLGATDPPWYYIRFQFTHPGRGATSALSSYFGYDLVSIHAPREGCDLSYTPLEAGLPQFQFTHPGRGATSRVQREFINQGAFQFTHPGRGATCSFFLR